MTGYWVGGVRYKLSSTGFEMLPNLSERSVLKHNKELCPEVQCEVLQKLATHYKVLTVLSGEASLLSWNATLTLYQCEGRPQPASGGTSGSSLCKPCKHNKK